jgi:Lar family restriction alleviation protein
MKLKPCPFCGGEARIYSTEFGDCHPVEYYGVTCDTEGCWVYENSESWHDTKKEAADEWNNRREG